MSTIEPLPPVPDFSEWVAEGGFTPAAQEFINALKRHSDAESTAPALASGVAWYDKTVNAWSTFTAVTSAVTLGYNLSLTPAKQNSKIRFTASFLLYPGTGVNTNITVKLLADGSPLETQTTIAGAWYCVPQLVFEHSPSGEAKTYDIEISASGTTNMHPGGSTFLAAQELEV